jgi:fructokinase
MAFGCQEIAMPSPKKRKPRLMATGFFALDIVFGADDPDPRFYVGGTSGNVSAGAAFFGWDVFPLARLGDDTAGQFVRGDLERWGVKSVHLGLAPVAATPIVLEKIELNKHGLPKHRFLWSCPDCSSYFPPFKPVLRTQAQVIKDQLDIPEVFFADRVSRSVVELARHFKEKGSLVYFEPSAAGDPKVFGEMLELCHILKYSAQRARSFSELLRQHSAHLEIETLGEDGLRFRTRRAFTTWHSLPAFEVNIKDTAGSGDWTTVGLITSLFREGKIGLQATKKELTAALEHSQALAALNCRFEGARGAMYQLNRSKIEDFVEAIKAGGSSVHLERKISLTRQITTSEVCPGCGPKKDPTLRKDRAVTLHS